VNHVNSKRQVGRPGVGGRGRPGEPLPDRMRQNTMRLSLRRAPSRAPYLLPAGLCAIALAACGSVASTANSGGSASSAASAASAGSTASAAAGAAAAKVSVIIEVTPRPGAKTEHWTLQCEPTGGTHPDAAAACRQLLAVKQPFSPVRHGMMCPMIVTGDETATIKGTWFGTPVDATFSQLSGCAAVRWQELGQVFNPVH
jgi:hypothetical protein